MKTESLKVVLMNLDWKLAEVLATNPFLLDLRGENQGRKCDFLLQDHGQHVQYYGHVFFVSWEDQLAAGTRAERGQKINFHMGKTQNFCRKKHRFV